MPLVRAKPKIHEGVCPFLRKGKCSIQAVKPAICGLFPLGRAFDNNGNVFYFLQDIRCGEKGEIHTVRDWIEAFGIPSDDKIAYAWSSATIEMANFIMKNKKRLSEKKLSAIQDIIFCYMYLDYDAENIDFISQLKKNFICTRAVYNQILYTKNADLSKYQKNKLLKFDLLESIDTVKKLMADHKSSLSGVMQVIAKTNENVMILLNYKKIGSNGYFQLVLEDNALEIDSEIVREATVEYVYNKFIIKMLEDL